MALPMTLTQRERDGRGGLRLFAVCCVAAGLLCGCTSFYEKQADKEAYPVIGEYQKKVDGGRAAETPAGVITPKPEGPQISTGRTAQIRSEAQVISLKEALALAFSTSRDFQYQKESLYLSALSYTAAIRNYRWHATGTISSSVEAQARGDTETSISAVSDATLSLTRKLLTGGAFTATAALHQSGNIEEADDSNSSNGSLAFTQPLLRGAGTAAREEYIQIQRSMLNAARGFETFRQDLVIRMMTQYYGIIRQKRTIENARARLDSANFNYERAKMLFDKDKQRLVDLLQTEDEKLQAENGLNDEIEAYNSSIDEFKLTLGLAMEQNVDVADETLEPDIITVNLEQAITTAVANRFDIMQARESLGDSERSLQIARNRLLPTLSFGANASVASDEGKNFWEMSMERSGEASAGLTLQIPIDNKADRDAYKSSVISLTRQRRSYEQTEERVRLNLRQTVRKLRQSELGLALQKKRIESAEKNREATQLQFERGTKSARDIVDADKTLQNAKDAYVQAQVDYVISSIQLRKDIGTLRVDEQGEWR